MKASIPQPQQACESFSRWESRQPRPAGRNPLCSYGCSAKPGFRRSPRGFTLLELLLALALTSLVIGMITMAIDLHLRTLDIKRTNVEQAIVARAVLRRMADDIRSAVLYQPIDVSGVQQMASDADLGTLGLDAGTQGASGTEGSSGGGGAPSGGESSTGRGSSAGGQSSGTEEPVEGADLGAEATDLGLDESASLNTVDIAGTVEPTSVPGLYGNLYELQVDVSRLPRVDQYEASLAATAAGEVPDIVSDVKTVAYFLRTEETTNVTVNMADQSLPMAPKGSGLVRRELDRAKTSWNAQNGTIDPSAGGGSLLAPEVDFLQFRYFDGLAWQEEWDSEQMGGLPVAIEITIGIDPTGGVAPETLDLTDVNDPATTDMNDYLYRLVVHVPAARATGLHEESLDAGTESLDTSDLLGGSVP